MKNIRNLPDLLLEIKRSFYNTDQSDKTKIILLGGCSRGGKTYVSNYIQNNLKKHGLQTLVVSLDCWLFSINQRKQGTTVLERYDVNNIVRSIVKLLNGETIFPPIYDSTTRMRICDNRAKPFQINNGLIIVEGVVALAIPELIERSSMNIFIKVPNVIRKKRLSKFYLEEKGVSEKEYNLLMKDREKEEVTFIKSTIINAEIIYNNSTHMKDKEVYEVF